MGWDVIADDYGVDGRPAVEPLERLSGPLVPLRLPPAGEEGQHQPRRDRPDGLRLRRLLLARPRRAALRRLPPRRRRPRVRPRRQPLRRAPGGQPRARRDPRRRLLPEPVGPKRRGRGRLPDLPPRGLRLRASGSSSSQNGNYRWAVVAGSRLGIVDGAVRRDQAAHRGLRDAPVQRRRHHHPRHVVAAAGRQLRVLPRHAPTSRSAASRGTTSSTRTSTTSRVCSCTACHPAGLDHQIAKGDEPAFTAAPGARRHDQGLRSSAT